MAGNEELAVRVMFVVELTHHFLVGWARGLSPPVMGDEVRGGEILATAVTILHGQRPVTRVWWEETCVILDYWNWRSQEVGQGAFCNGRPDTRYPGLVLDGGNRKSVEEPLVMERLLLFTSARPRLSRHDGLL